MLMVYSFVGCPIIYSGQNIKTEIISKTKKDIKVKLFIKYYGEGDKLSKINSAEYILSEHETETLEWNVPDTFSNPIAQIGISISSDEQVSGKALMNYLHISGIPQMTFRKPDHIKDNHANTKSHNIKSLTNLKESYGIENVYLYDGKNHNDIYFSIKKKYKKIKFVIDAVSGDLGKLCWKLLSPDGVFFSYGALSNDHNINVDIVSDLCRDNKTMKGWSIQGTWLRQKSNNTKLKMIDEIWDLFRSKKLILPPLGKSFNMEQFKEALLESMKPQKNGKITLNINSKKT